MSIFSRCTNFWLNLLSIRPAALSELSSTTFSMPDNFSEYLFKLLSKCCIFSENWLARPMVLSESFFLMTVSRYRIFSERRSST